MSKPNRIKRMLLTTTAITTSTLLAMCASTNNDDRTRVYANPKGPVYEPVLDAGSPTQPSTDSGPAQVDAGTSTPPTEPPKQDAAVKLDASSGAVAPIRPRIYANPKGARYDKNLKSE